MNQQRKGVNWVKNLSEYVKCLNNEKRVELVCWSAFEVYYGRNSNELVKCGVRVNRENDYFVQQVMLQSKKRLYKRQRRIDEERKKVKNANKNVCVE